MERQMNKRTKFLLVFILPLVLLAAILAILQFGTHSLSAIESGVQAGYGVAVLVWGAFIVSVVAIASLVVIMALHTFHEGPLDRRVLRIYLPAGFAAIVVVLLALQFGTNILTGIERGVSDGVVPLSLAGIASILSVLGTLGAFFYTTRLKANPLVLHPDGGMKTDQVIVEEVVAAQPHPQVQEPAPPPSSPPPDPVHTKTAHEEPPAVTVQDLKLVETFVSQKDFATLAGQPSPQSSEDKDLIQTKANVAEWILLSLKLGGKVAKAKLESSFEDQFPKIYVPLFNSVLYDLIYKNKVDSVKEGSRMMLFLKAGSDSSSSKA